MTMTITAKKGEPMKTTVRERMEAIMNIPGTEMPMCANCTHYHPHYTKDGRPFLCGHCPYPRMKPRRAYDLCEYFQMSVHVG